MGLTGAKAVLEYSKSGFVKTSTFIDGSIAAFLAAGSIIPGPWTPYFWAAGVIYGGIRLVAGDYIDKYIDE